MPNGRLIVYNMPMAEWEPCRECGAPVIERDGFLVDAIVYGRHAAGQIDADVEHECNERA